MRISYLSFWTAKDDESQAEAYDANLKEILSEYRIAHDQNEPSSVLMLIGPEGDFTPSEINLAMNFGCSPMTLGPIVLRSETAALYSLSILSYELS